MMHQEGDRLGVPRWSHHMVSARLMRAAGQRALLASIVPLVLIGELHLSKLGETVVVHGNAPHDRPSFL
jgi:hypothetical protein